LTMRQLVVVLCLLFSAASAIAQTQLHGLIAGQSVRADVERSAGPPTKFYSQTLVEYHPANVKVWSINITKLYVQYRVDSPIVERLEVLLARPMNRADAMRNLDISAADSHQPDLPDQPAARGKNGDRLVEYFGPPYYIVLTYQGSDVNSGVARTARYSKELYESAVKLLAGSGVPAANPGSALASRSGPVTGRWSGSWTNTHGGSGQNSMTLSERNGIITGDVSGAPIVNGRRYGNMLTWENLNVANCRDYVVRFDISPDGNLLNGAYQVNDRCSHQTYSGNYLNFHK
jgi:hypothetical protein